jgi:hypothetical protein
MRLHYLPMIAAWLLLTVSVQAQDVLADLELALAVDSSASVDDGEYRLQLQGIAHGIRDRQVLEAIAAGAHGRIAVMLSVWAEAEVPKDFSDWYLISNAADAERFATLVETFPRRLSGGTGLGAGIARTIAAFDNNGITAERQVIDVSGDGEETTPRSFVVIISQARAMAMARGVTINGLAVLNEVPDLDAWYRRHMQTGPGSFVMSVASYEDFAQAMRRKLLREVLHLPQLSMR